MDTRIIRRGGLLLLAASLTAASAAADGSADLKGSWSLNNWTAGASVHLTMKHASGSSRWAWSSDQLIVDLHGLTKEQLHAGNAPVTFTLSRDAGTFTFDGSVMLGLGRGEFRFAADPAFSGKLQALGYEAVPDKDLFAMALRDISIAYASEVMRSGIKGATLGDLVRFRDHGVELDVIRDFASIGYANLRPDDVIRLRDHGVETELLRTLKAAGMGDLAASEVIELSDHGVDAGYIEGLQDSGRGKLSADEIVKLKDHGIDPGFIKGLLSARRGLTDVDDIIRLREHGVDPDYVARIESAGFTGLSVDQIIRLREHGID